MKDKPPPISGLRGWGAAQKILDRCKEDRRKELLTSLVRSAGVQTAPALEYVARRLRWHTDDADVPTPPLKLTTSELRYCERRVIELLTPFHDGGDPRVKKWRGMDSGLALVPENDGKAA